LALPESNRGMQDRLPELRTLQTNR
jgi:hypothetical protein